MHLISRSKCVWLAVLALYVSLFLDTGLVEAKSKPKKAKPSSSRSSGGGEELGADYVTEKRGDTTVKYKKKTTYDFEGLGVEAMADKPTGAYISNIKDVRARSLIQIRKDFDAEVNETARQMP